MTSSAPGARERGFTLIEALVALAIGTLIGFTAVAVCATTANALARTAAATGGTAALDAQTAQLRADAASALAVFLPPLDMYGRPNTGQELDFYTRSDAGTPLYWRYVYDARTRTLARWDYSGGSAGVRDVRSGTIDTGAAYPPLRDVTRFSAAALPADRLGDAGANPYGGIGALLDRVPEAISVPYGAAAGGNGVVEVALASGGAARLVHLAAGTVAAGFTVTGAPVWHAVVYRVDQTHRSWLGLAGKSHVFINARVDVSYDDWKTSIAWCDFNLLGNPDGLDGNDRHANYAPDEPIEQSASILAACRQTNPKPPPPESAGNPPEPSAVHPPLPADTPPPCWTRPGPAGRCWPPDAPANWMPPGLAPGERPPERWCAAHPRSAACGAPASAGRAD